VALRAKTNGHPVIAVTSMQHTAGVQPKHSSGKRLHEIADVVIDNLAPYGDATLDLGDGIVMGAVSSITAAFIGQLLSLGV
ncbi:sugar isomerase, partial [Vibrio cholerae O1 biovar El Tor]|nr:sugar isomerase [Vibrio cholerae O1 biovar El Tor]